jgi:membrane protease YdiL (CAAX protease family)
MLASETETTRRALTGENRARDEWPWAAGLFAFALAVFWVQTTGRASAESAAAAVVTFALLTATTLALSVTAWREALAATRAPFLLKLFALPLAITVLVALYSAITHLPVIPRGAAFGVYLALPAVIVGTGGSRSPSPVRVLLAAASLWLPIEFDLLPSLRLPEPGGLRAVQLAGLTTGLFLFLISCPLDRVGYTFRLDRRDVGLAVFAAVVFAIVGVPIGLATGFLEWNPRLDWARMVVAPVAIYLATAIPEEFLFRGLIQNALERMTGRAGLPVASVIFGFAHLPDFRYALLATVAGFAYGWVYSRTRRITAAAITHALVDWIWVLLLRG